MTDIPALTLPDLALGFMLGGTVFKDEPSKTEALASLKELAQKMPETNPAEQKAKTDLLAELADPEKSKAFFIKNPDPKGSGEVINPAKMKAVTAAVVAGLGNAAVMGNDTAKIKMQDATGKMVDVVVVGKMLPDGSFIPSAYVPEAEGKNALKEKTNPIPLMKPIPEADRKPVKTLEDLQVIVTKASAPAVAPAPPPVADKATMTQLPAEQKNKILDNLVTVNADNDDKKKTVIAKLTKLVGAMPEGTKKAELMTQLSAPDAKDKLFEGPVLNDTFKAEFKAKLADSVVKIKTKSGKERVVLAGTTGVGKVRAMAELPVDDADKAGSLDKVKIAKDPSKSKEVQGTAALDNSLKMAQEDTNEFADIVEEIDNKGTDLEGKDVTTPPPGPVVTEAATSTATGVKRITTRKSFIDRIMNQGAGIGAVLGGFLGFMGLGPIGVIIGLALGALVGSMITGNNPFSDTESLNVSPTDGKVQVRLPEGDTPTVEMHMEGPPGKNIVVTGMANGDKFEISEATLESKVKGERGATLRFKPPKTIPVGKDGMINKDDIYRTLDLPIPAVPVAAPAGPAAGAAPVPAVAIPAGAVGVEVKEIKVGGAAYDKAKALADNDKVSVLVEAKGPDGKTKKFRVEGEAYSQAGDDKKRIRVTKMVAIEPDGKETEVISRASTGAPTAVFDPSFILRETDLQNPAQIVTALTEKQTGAAAPNPFQDAFKTAMGITAAAVVTGPGGVPLPPGGVVPPRPPAAGPVVPPAAGPVVPPAAGPVVPPAAGPVVPPAAAPAVAPVIQSITSVRRTKVDLFDGGSKGGTFTYELEVETDQGPKTYEIDGKTKGGGAPVVFTTIRDMDKKPCNQLHTC